VAAVNLVKALQRMKGVKVSYAEIGPTCFIFYDRRREVVPAVAVEAGVGLAKELERVMVVNFVRICRG